jgi:hypothetical protein
MPYGKDGRADPVERRKFRRFKENCAVEFVSKAKVPPEHQAILT